MAYVRLTVVRPTARHRAEALEVLRELDKLFADEHGLVMSLVFHDEQSVGRLAVWETESEPNEMARNELALALRSRLAAVPGEHVIEMLAAADTGTWSPGALELLAGVLGWNQPRS